MYKIKTYVPLDVDYGKYDLHQSNYHPSGSFLCIPPPPRATATDTAPDARLPYIIALHLHAGVPPPG